MNAILPIKCNEHIWVFFSIEATVKSSRLQAFPSGSALARAKCGFENRMKNTFFIRSVSHTENYSYMLYSSSASPLPSCNIEQAYSIKKHVGMCSTTIAASTTRKAHTIDPNWQCFSARRRGFPRTKTRLLYIVNPTFGEQPYYSSSNCTISNWKYLNRYSEFLIINSTS